MPILAKEPSLFPGNLFTDESTGEGRCWWAMFTRSRQEKAIARYLHSEGIPFFLPLIAKDNLIRGRVIQSHIPLFPRYLFVFGSEDERVQTLATRRVETVLVVHDQDQLRHDLSHVHSLIETNAPLTVESRLVPGDKVRIKSGTLAGLEGTVLLRRGRTQLLVTVRFLQQGVSLEVDDFMLEPVG